MIIEFNKKNIPKPPTFLLDRFRYVTALFVVAIVLCYFFVDRPVALLCQNTHLYLIDFARLISGLTSPSAAPVILATLFFFMKFLLKKEKKSSRIWMCSLAVPLSIFLGYVIKIPLGRYRPDLFLHKGLYGFHFFGTRDTMLSFPSGHACVISALLCSCACFYPKATYKLLVWALLLSLVRVVLNAHYVSDVLAGVYIGLITAQFTYKAMKFQKVF